MSPRLLSRLGERLRPPHHLRSVYERLLGTEVEVQVVAGTQVQAEAAEDAALCEIERLTTVLNRFDPESEFSRWLQTRGAPVLLSPDLRAVLQHADTWRERTRGAWHPGADALGVLWREAAALGKEPDAAELERLTGELQAAPWVLHPGGTATLHAAYPLGLNALAKGHVVDRALEAALNCPGVRSVLVNAGGDLHARGEAGVVVAVADPFTPRDDTPPVAHVPVRNAALATSGGAHRGYQVGAAWHSHLLDPRTGRPVTGVPGVTVLAPDCCTADALATALSVLSLTEGLLLVDGVPDAAALLVTRDGARHTSARWPASSPHPDLSPPGVDPHV
ncbi:FAD:protein FMN transferase [Deinococcus hopiensis]|uniref:FAD:protein FMN transferase n=1 Tax=Deinococcus hopiensis KR-140 TaxID=695939 RepID=A0A1W1UG31_9DEIO|nr:FAD:protein FMN transferase [Deinococcus hopiensis]SMB79744.1 thiamine biosynthesis lipoprotein [Deinococcus hopiensis KR-140]